MTKIISPICDNILLIYKNDWMLDLRGECLDLEVRNFEVLVSLFPFLENNNSFYVAQIDKRYSKAIKRFPAKQIIEAGFICGTAHLAKLAVEWLDNENNINLNIYFSSYLNEIVDDKFYKQRTRQIAEKILDNILSNFKI